MDRFVYIEKKIAFFFRLLRYQSNSFRRHFTLSLFFCCCYYCCIALLQMRLPFYWLLLFSFFLFYCCDENICIVATTVAKTFVSFVFFVFSFDTFFLGLTTNYRTLTHAHEKQNQTFFRFFLSLYSIFPPVYYRYMRIFLFSCCCCVRVCCCCSFSFFN
jgi:hypothetical protein